MSDPITRRSTTPLPPSTQPLAKSGTSPGAEPGPEAAGPTELPQESVLSLSTEGLARPRLSLPGPQPISPLEPLASRRPPRPQTAPLELPGQEQRLSDFMKYNAKDRGPGWVSKRLEFLRSYAEMDLASIPADAREFLQREFGSLTNQLPALREQFELLATDFALNDLAASDPAAARRALNAIKALAAASAGASAADAHARVTSQLQALSPEARATCEQLGLNQPYFVPLLGELSQRNAMLLNNLEALADKTIPGGQTDFINFDPVAFNAPERWTGQSSPSSQELADARAEFDLKLMSQQSKAVYLKSASKQGLASVMAKAGGINADLLTLLKEVDAYTMTTSSRAADGSIDYSGFSSKVDLSKGLNAVMLKMILMSGSFENGKPTLSNEMIMLQRVCETLLQDGAAGLDAGDRELLTRFGIGINSDNQPVNLANQEPIRKSDFQDLMDVQRQLAVSLTDTSTKSELRSVSLMVQRFQTVMKQTRIASELETRIETGNRKLADLTRKAAQTTEAMRKNQDAQQKLQPQLAAAEAAYKQKLAPLLPYLKDGRIELDSLSADERRQARAALASIGIVVDSSGRFTYEGQIHEAEDFEAVMSACLDGIARPLRELKAQRDALLDEAAKLSRESLQIEAEIKTTSDQQSSDLRNYSTAIDSLKQVSDAELDAYVQSAEFKALPYFERQHYLTELALRKALIARAPDLFAKSQWQIGKALEALGTMVAARSDLDLISEQLARAFDKLPAAMLKLLNDQLNRIAETLRARLQRPGEAADELERRLNLAPVPQGDELARLTARWKLELEAIHELARRNLEQSRNQQLAASSSEAKFLARIQDQTKHHLKALEKLDQRRSEQVQQLLQDSLKSLKAL